MASMTSGRDIDWDEQRGRRSLDRLDEAHEQKLMQSLVRYPEAVELAARQRAPQHIEECVGAFSAHVALIDQRVALTAVASGRGEVGPVVERKHHHGLAALWQSGARVQVDVRVVGTCRTNSDNQRCNGRRDRQFSKLGIHS